MTSAPPSPGATCVTLIPVSLVKAASTSSLTAKESWVTSVMDDVEAPVPSSASPLAVVGLVAGTEKLTREVLTACPQLRCISRVGVGIDGVDLAAQKGERLGGLLLLAHFQVAEDYAEHFGCELLGGVAPGVVGVAVALDDKPVETHVEGLLRERSYEFALAADV